MPLRRRQVTYSQRPNHAARSAHARGERQFKTYDTSYIRPRRSKAPMVFAVVLALLVVVLVAFGVTTFMKGCSAQPELLAEGQTVQVEVAEGSGAKAIGNQLQEAKLVASSSEFTKRVSELGADSQLKPGAYTFEGGMSIDEIISLLTTGPGMENGLTIPEGYTISQIAARVAEVTEGRITAQEFQDAASDASVYAADFPFLAEAGTASLEGFLFPKTYAVPDNATADKLIRIMLAQYQAEIAALDFSYPASLGLSAYDTLKLASIVEKESGEDHRATVASVFYNRLTTEGEPSYGFLQSDATTAYEVGGDPTPEQVHAETPYSTYANKGLPPTPICSPGIECLKAVCAPETTGYFFFYFAPDENGVVQYHFTETYEDHQATFS